MGRRGGGRGRGSLVPGNCCVLSLLALDVNCPIIFTFVCEEKVRSVCLYVCVSVSACVCVCICVSLCISVLCVYMYYVLYIYVACVHICSFRLSIHVQPQKNILTRESMKPKQSLVDPERLV